MQTADGNDSTREDAPAGEDAGGGALEAAAAGAAGTAAGDSGAAASIAPVKKGPTPKTKGGGG